MKLKNLEMELMLTILDSLLAHRDKVGYVAARNTRILATALTEYTKIKNDLIKEHGIVNDDGTAFINETCEGFDTVRNALNEIKDCEHEVDIMKLKYDEVIGILNGKEILQLEFMLED